MKTSYTALTPQHWPKTPLARPPKRIRGAKITILGCGVSTGVPVLGCQCSTCRSKNPRNFRSRASVVIQAENKNFLIDTSPDLRAQAFRSRLYWIDAVLFTHPHADHLHGIDDLRTFNFLMARRIRCYGNRWSIETLENRFDYIFKATQLGGGKPLLETCLITRGRSIEGVRVQPLELIHGRMPVLGYRIKDVAYITDCSYIPERTYRYLKNLRVLVLDCLRPREHSTHLNLEGAMSVARRIGAKKTYFTHMGHELEYEAFSKQLPRNFYPAYDGLVIRA